MSKQATKTRTPMTRKQNNYGNSSDYRATPVGEMEAWDLQWAYDQQQEERQWHDDNKNYLEN